METTFDTDPKKTADESIVELHHTVNEAAELEDPDWKQHLVMQSNSQDNCLIDIQCEFGDKEIDPTTQEFLYNSEISYQCGVGRAFYDPDNEQVVMKQTFNCGWDKKWSPEPNLLQCQCKPIFFF